MATTNTTTTAPGANVNSVSNSGTSTGTAVDNAPKTSKSSANVSRIVVNTVVVERDGVLVTCPIGKPFDFTSKELKEIEKAMPGAVREPVNEAADKDGDL